MCRKSVRRRSVIVFGELIEQDAIGQLHTLTCCLL